MNPRIVEVPHSICSTIACLIVLICAPALAEPFQISGGTDLRYHIVSGKPDSLEMEGLFLNFRKIFKDEKGDRLIAVGQIDFDHNFEKTRPYQAYLQYKGPFGKWNIRIGRYLLPYGLLSEYDTERLPLRSLELLNLGIRLDTGIELLGFAGDLDYALSVSQGIGDGLITDSDQNKLVTARIGWRGEDWTLGLSWLTGAVSLEEKSVVRKDLGVDTLYEKRLGIDYTRSAGPLTLRTELSLGEDDYKTVGGGLVRADYALTPNLEINLKYAQWERLGTRHFVGLGLTYGLGGGISLRLADENQYGKEQEHDTTVQIYYEFIKHF